MQIKPLFPVSDFNIDATSVAIIGSGPNVTQGIDRIPPACYRIVLNGAIALDSGAASWVCVDNDCKNHGWFRHFNQRYQGIRLFHPLLINKAVTHDNPAPIYMVLANNNMLMTADEAAIIPGQVRGMHLGTVAATAAQIAYQFTDKLRKLYYCGIDMSGDQHIDGSTSNREHGDSWPCVPAFNRLNEWLEQHGTKCYTLSDTKLALRRI